MRRTAALLITTTLLLPASAASLTWTRVAELPATDVESVQRHGTTVYATAGDRVYLGADNGVTWNASSPVGGDGAPLFTVIPAGGALWVGSYGQGVFRSPDGGATWSPVNAGLIGLGAKQVPELVSADDTLYAATDGAGVFLLELSGPMAWTPFSHGLPLDIAGTVATIVLHGSTRVAPAGGNGFVYRYPRGATAWQAVSIQPPILPGFVASDLASDGKTLLVTSGSLTYRSVDDAQSWVRFDTGLANGVDAFLAHDDATFFAVVNLADNSHRLYRITGTKTAWEQIDQVVDAYAYEIEVAGDRILAARTDGLWWTPLASTATRSSTWGEIKSRFGTPAR